MFRKEFLVIVVVLLLQHVSVFGQQRDTTYQIPANVMKQINIEKSEAAWLEELGPEKYKILRQCSTEPPFTGKYYDHKEEGTYVCAGCGTPLFDSDTKYESGSGWPSFFAAIGKDKIKEVRDTSYGMIRTEIKCATCDGHLGHVFTDGPPPTGLRYCVNSASMDFVPAKAK
ncbi:MAG: peptide-methionine (R)-S-oxide reductase MsrB [Bacteroidales bacterium]|nr:peptide-methionine (R)-S-oxide reductase MsrB [Bacteroidales bacterium]